VSARQRGALVLVVDDDKDVRELAATVLRGAGYRVLVAGSGGHALVMFERHPDIALIFTDIILPDFEGFKLADVAKFRRPEIRILYTTGAQDRARDKLGVVHGPILAKPYRPDQLERIVAEALRSP
jgi:CheY-like chemotaxis protein